MISVRLDCCLLSLASCVWRYTCCLRSLASPKASRPDQHTAMIGTRRGAVPFLTTILRALTNLSLFLNVVAIVVLGHIDASLPGMRRDPGRGGLFTTGTEGATRETERKPLKSYTFPRYTVARKTIRRAFNKRSMEPETPLRLIVVAFGTLSNFVVSSRVGVWGYVCPGKMTGVTPSTRWRTGARRAARA